MARFEGKTKGNARVFHQTKQKPRILPGPQKLKISSSKRKGQTTRGKTRMFGLTKGKAQSEKRTTILNGKKNGGVKERGGWQNEN